MVVCPPVQIQQFPQPHMMAPIVPFPQQPECIFPNVEFKIGTHADLDFRSANPRSAHPMGLELINPQCLPSTTTILSQNILHSPPSTVMVPRQPPPFPGAMCLQTTTGHHMATSPSFSCSSSSSPPVNCGLTCISPSSQLTNFTFPPNWGQSYGMEQVWHGEFVKLFSQYFPNIWYLSPITQRPNGQWNYFMDSAKVRFCCDDCGHGWTSMKGRVVFWYFFNSASGEGIIKFKLYGQRCQKCNSNRFESAMWYPEEVVKVLVNIYNKVGQIYYGFYQPPIHKARRPGKPRNPHNQELCQACQDGVCSERRVSSTENSL